MTRAMRSGLPTVHATGPLRGAIVLTFTLVALAACGDDDGESQGIEGAADDRTGGAEVPALPSLFPLAPGDRWRTEAGEQATPHNTGVTGREPSGTSVVHGTSHTLAERYRVTDEEIALVSDDGDVLVPVLRAPLRVGTSWRYALEDREVEVPCEATVRTVGVAERVAGAALEGCVEVLRRCEYPEGQPFPAETVHETEELYCPGVGRVRERTRFDPPPSDAIMPASRTEQVVGWRVAGAPPMPSAGSFGCASFILLPSDVQAACGAAVQPDGPASGDPGEDRCTYRYRTPEGAIEVAAERRAEAPGEAAVDEAIGATEETPAQTHDGVRVVTADRVRFGFGDGPLLVTVAADAAACPEASAIRLAPLLRSLIRR